MNRLEHDRVLFEELNKGQFVSESVLGELFVSLLISIFTLHYRQGIDRKME